jgi:hypothetical protein
MKWKKILLRHLVDTTAILVVVTIIFAAIEIYIYDLSIQISYNSRIFIFIIHYLGVGFLFSFLRDKMRKVFEITNKSKEYIIQIFDLVYNFCFVTIISLITYSYNGVLFPEFIIISIVSGIMVAPLGIFIGYSIDFYRALFYNDNNKRIPLIFRKQKKNIRWLILIGVTIILISLVGLVYMI